MRIYSSHITGHTRIVFIVCYLSMQHLQNHMTEKLFLPKSCTIGLTNERKKRAGTCFVHVNNKARTNSQKQPSVKKKRIAGVPGTGMHMLYDNSNKHFLQRNIAVLALETIPQNLRDEGLGKVIPFLRIKNKNGMKKEYI